VWFVIESSLNARAWRIRESGGAILAIQQIYLSVPTVTGTGDRYMTPLSYTQWMQIPTKLSQGFPSSYFFNADTGFVCGSNGLISKSYHPINNRGLQITGSASSLNAVYFEKNVGLSVGDGGSIYRTTNKGGYGLGLISNIETPFLVYPNPSNGVCTISQSEDIENIRVYNALGEEIQYEMNANSSEIRFPGNGLFMIQIKSKNLVYRQSILVY
jgi:hypothetical protein